MMEKINIKLHFLHYLWFFTLSLSGCANLSYYYQALEGQTEILQNMTPLEEVISNPQTSPALRQQLQQAKEIRHFATDKLYLPQNASYTQFIDLKRKYVVWNVYATPRFSLVPNQWCFPIIGCLSYRGYFSPEPAFEEGRILKEQGFDVYVAGIRAYSTLGWFSDPLLNTMLSKETWQLAALIFHELTHQLLYVSDDSTFNESFASAVEEIGLQLWLEQQGNSEDFKTYQLSKQRSQQMTFLVLHTKQKLAELYKQNLPEDEMLNLKNNLLNELQENYKKLKEKEWNNYQGYDRWFEGINNAKLLSVAMYEEYVPAFKVLFEKSNRNFKEFYEEIRKVAALPKTKRHQYLLELSSK